MSASAPSNQNCVQRFIWAPLPAESIEEHLRQVDQGLNQIFTLFQQVGQNFQCIDSKLNDLNKRVERLERAVLINRKQERATPFPNPAAIRPPSHSDEEADC